MSKRLVLLDGTNYAFRAFYAIPLLTNSQGFPTNALTGYANMLAQYIREDRPDYIAVAFDAKGPTHRKKRYPPYKAQRKPTPEELIMQLPWFRKVTECLNIPFLELEGFEADDIIATIVERTRDEDLTVQIISMDKDLMQLVDHRVTLLDTLRKATFDPRAVEKKWGVPPSQLRDVLALQGDTSDNIPGVRSIGPKKAQALIKEFHSVPELLGRLEEVSNDRTRKALMEYKEEAALSYELVTLVMDVPLEMPLQSLALQQPDPEACTAVFEELEFRRLLTLFGVRSEPETRLSEVIRLPADRGGLEAMAKALEGTSEIALVVVGEGRIRESSLSAISIAGQSGLIWWLPLAGEGALPQEDVRAVLQPILRNPALEKVGHGIKQAVLRLRHWGFEVDGIAGDTGLAAYLLNPSRATHTLEALAATVIGQNLSPDDAMPGAAEARVVLEIHEKLKEQLESAGMLALYQELEVPQLTVLGELEWTGIRLDCGLLETQSSAMSVQIGRTETRIMALAGMEFNPNSPKQLQAVLFDKLELPVIKKTKTGPSTNHRVLEKLAEQHPLPAEILKYRSMVKLKNTYLDALPALVNEQTGRVHTTFNLTVAATGRLSSSDPNLQNIPVRTEEGRQIRRAFVPMPGWKLISVDYSQIELRLLAHFCEDETLTKAFKEGQDIHRATAAIMHDMDPALVSSGLRREAKAINFGILYGMGPRRLADELKISFKQAAARIEQYFERYSKVKGFMDQTLERARELGYVTTISNRRRYIPELKSSKAMLRQAGERIAINTPIQGSAADLIKMAMHRIHRHLCQGAWATRMLLQVHDELVFETPEEEIEPVSALIKAEMEGVVSLKVPLTVDLGIGDNWAEAH